MALRIPKNQIITGKYTTGEEYVVLSSHAPYQGYYYNLNGRTFAGKEFNPKAPEIIRTTSGKFNPLLNNPATTIYAKLSKIKLDDFNPPSYFFQKKSSDGKYVNRYFAQKINIVPILIKEISKESYEKLQTNPLYKSITILWNTIEDNITELNIAEIQMPGITLFLQNLNFDPLSDVDEYPDFYNPLDPPAI